MKEYKITFEAEAGIIFKKSVRGMDVVKANSAKEATDLWEEENRDKIREMRLHGIRFSILDIQEI